MPVAAAASSSEFPPPQTETLDRVPPLTLQNETPENQTVAVSDLNQSVTKPSAEESKDGDHAEDQSGIELGEEENDGDGDEEAECGFCLFMKGGGCKEQFISWEKCVEEAEKNNGDIVEKCFEVTSLLKKCMDLHSDYYEPILRAEKAMEEQVSLELDQETDAEAKKES